MASKCLFEYCNYGTGYLKATLLGNAKQPSRELTISLEDYELKDGVIENIASLSQRIREGLKLEKNASITLVLICEEIYKTVYTLPNMNFIQAKLLYQKEMKTKSDSAYDNVSFSYRHKLGYVFNTYYIPKSTIFYFKKLAKLLGARLTEVKPFALFLKSRLTPHKEPNAYFYIRNKVCTMLLMDNKSLIDAFDFEYSDEKDIVNNFLLVLTKHEFELSCKKIAFYKTDSDDILDFDLGIPKQKGHE